jgi:hypothetical protein
VADNGQEFEMVPQKHTAEKILLCPIEMHEELQ